MRADNLRRELGYTIRDRVGGNGPLMPTTRASDRAGPSGTRPACVPPDEVA